MRKKTLASFFFLLFYKIIYEMIYACYVSPLFYYSKLVYIPVRWKMVLSYALFVLLVSILPTRWDRPSTYLLNIFFIFTIIPILSLYWQANRATLYVLMCATAFSLLCVVCRLWKWKRDYVLQSGIKVKLNVTYILVFTVLVSLVLLTIKYGVPDSRALNLYNVYDVRQDHSFSGIWGYIINWLPYSLIPALLCISLYKRNIISLLFGIGAQLFLFLLTGSKTTLFSIGLILVSYFLVEYNWNFINGWVCTLSAICFISVVVLKVANELMLFGIFPTRLASIPASISFNHYDFFSQNRKLYLCETFLGRLFDIKSPYDKFSTYLVSTGTSNANTGYLGDAFDNGGFPFMILYSLILGIILCCIDSIYLKKKEKPLPVFVGLLTYTMIYLNDGTLTAVLLTGGLTINILLLSMFCDMKKQTKERAFFRRKIRWRW